MWKKILSRLRKAYSVKREIEEEREDEDQREDSSSMFHDVVGCESVTTHVIREGGQDEFFEAMSPLAPYKDKRRTSKKRGKLPNKPTPKVRAVCNMSSAYGNASHRELSWFKSASPHKVDKDAHDTRFSPRESVAKEDGHSKKSGSSKASCSEGHKKFVVFKPLRDEGPDHKHSPKKVLLTASNYSPRKPRTPKVSHKRQKDYKLQLKIQTSPGSKHLKAKGKKSLTGEEKNDFEVDRSGSKGLLKNDAGKVKLCSLNISPTGDILNIVTPAESPGKKSCGCQAGQRTQKGHPNAYQLEIKFEKSPMMNKSTEGHGDGRILSNKTTKFTGNKRAHRCTGCHDGMSQYMNDAKEPLPQSQASAHPRGDEDQESSTPITPSTAEDHAYLDENVNEDEMFGRQKCSCFKRHRGDKRPVVKQPFSTEQKCYTAGGSSLPSSPFTGKTFQGERPSAGMSPFSESKIPESFMKMNHTKDKATSPQRNPSRKPVLTEQSPNVSCWLQGRPAVHWQTEKAGGDNESQHNSATYTISALSKHSGRRKSQVSGRHDHTLTLIRPTARQKTKLRQGQGYGKAENIGLVEICVEERAPDESSSRTSGPDEKTEAKAGKGQQSTSWSSSYTSAYPTTSSLSNIEVQRRHDQTLNTMCSLSPESKVEREHLKKKLFVEDENSQPESTDSHCFAEGATPRKVYRSNPKYPISVSTRLRRRHSSKKHKQNKKVLFRELRRLLSYQTELKDPLSSDGIGSHQASDLDRHQQSLSPPYDYPRIVLLKSLETFLNDGFNQKDFKRLLPSSKLDDRDSRNTKGKKVFYEGCRRTTDHPFKWCCDSDILILEHGGNYGNLSSPHGSVQSRRSSARHRSSRRSDYVNPPSVMIYRSSDTDGPVYGRSSLRHPYFRTLGSKRFRKASPGGEKVQADDADDDDESEADSDNEVGENDVTAKTTSDTLKGSSENKDKESASKQSEGSKQQTPSRKASQESDLEALAKTDEEKRPKKKGKKKKGKAPKVEESPEETTETSMDQGELIKPPQEASAGPASAGPASAGPASAGPASRGPASRQPSRKPSDEKQSKQKGEKTPTQSRRGSLEGAEADPSQNAKKKAQSPSRRQPGAKDDQRVLASEKTPAGSSRGSPIRKNPTRSSQENVDDILMRVSRILEDSNKVEIRAGPNSPGMPMAAERPQYRQQSPAPYTINKSCDDSPGRPIRPMTTVQNGVGGTAVPAGSRFSSKCKYIVTQPPGLYGRNPCQRRQPGCEVPVPKFFYDCGDLSGQKQIQRPGRKRSSCLLLQSPRPPGSKPTCPPAKSGQQSSPHWCRSGEAQNRNVCPSDPPTPRQAKQAAPNSYNNPYSGVETPNRIRFAAGPSGVGSPCRPVLTSAGMVGFQGPNQEQNSAQRFAAGPSGVGSPCRPVLTSAGMVGFQGPNQEQNSLQPVARRYYGGNDASTPRQYTLNFYLTNVTDENTVNGAGAGTRAMNKDRDPGGPSGGMDPRSPRTAKIHKDFRDGEESDDISQDPNNQQGAYLSPEEDTQNGRTTDEDQSEEFGLKGTIVYQSACRCATFSGIRVTGGVRVLLDIPNKTAYLQIISRFNEVYITYYLNTINIINSTSAAGVAWSAVVCEPDEKNEKDADKAEDNSTEDETKGDDTEPSKKSRARVDSGQVIFADPQQAQRFRIVLDVVITAFSGRSVVKPVPPGIEVFSEDMEQTILPCPPVTPQYGRPAGPSRPNTFRSPAGNSVPISQKAAGPSGQYGASRPPPANDYKPVSDESQHCCNIEFPAFSTPSASQEFQTSRAATPSRGTPGAKSGGAGLMSEMPNIGDAGWADPYSLHHNYSKTLFSALACVVQFGNDMSWQTIFKGNLKLIQDANKAGFRLVVEDAATTITTLHQNISKDTVFEKQNRTKCGFTYSIFNRGNNKKEKFLVSFQCQEHADLFKGLVDQIHGFLQRTKTS